MMAKDNNKYFVVGETARGRIHVDIHKSRLEANVAILTLEVPYTILFVSCGPTLDGSKRLRLVERPDKTGHEIEEGE